MSKQLFLLLGFVLSGLAGCRKFLAKSPDISLVQPSSISDFRTLLDNNALTVNVTPGLGPLSADDIEMDTAVWNKANSVLQGAYIWKPSIYQQGNIAKSWANPYAAINICNVVLGGMDKLHDIDAASRMEFNAVYGSALFYRAFCYYNLEETYGQPHRPESAGMLPGVPLRLTDDASRQTPRAPVDSVYSQIINDLRRSLSLLPAGVQPYHNRPGIPAALALMARVCLSRQDYPSALYWADSCLRTWHELLDYNIVRGSGLRPFPDSTNPEILFQCSVNDYLSAWFGQIKVDSALFSSYARNDLRRSVFFQPMVTGGGVFFKGNYTGGFFLFSGLSIDETLLIRAECNARAGNTGAALEDINTLLLHRWKTGTFQPYTTMPADSALRLVLQERRKETLCRELRWFDLRRLNQDTHFAITLKRSLGNILYTLPPNDLLYAFQIPISEIQLGGLQQNPTP